MDITASNHIVLKDILVGDVWFCSGQSNMVLNMERVKEKYADEIAHSENTEIRNFFIPAFADIKMLHSDLAAGEWIACKPKTVLDFGAVAYFFAKQLYQKYHIPIGIINSSVGGTPIQAWISEKGIREVPAYANRLTQLKDTAYLDSIKQNCLIVKPNKPLNDSGLTDTKKWYDPSYIAIGWHHFWLPGYWEDQGIRNLNGVVWFRREINVPVEMTGKPVNLYMGRIVDADAIYINGALAGSTTYQYPPRRYVLPKGVLKPGKNLIVARVTNYSGKGGFVPDKAYELKYGNQSIDLRGDWQYKVGEVFRPSVNNSSSNFSAQNEPTGLYNAIVAPVIPYKIKGIVWYQGEANTDKPYEYEQLLRTLITDWRDKWDEGTIPFIYAQLPNFMEVQYSPAESQWAELREAQLKVLKVPNTAMAVTIDAGEWNDIHPLDKKDVGDRLALAAEKMAYGDKEIVSSGPLFRSAEVEGDKIVIDFSDTGSGLVIKNKDDGFSQFAIAGADKKYVWANTMIKGNEVVVWNDEVKHPIYVRYAWADNPQGAGLYNKEGLPASPFTTDTK